MFNFIKRQQYRRQEIWETVQGKNKKMSRNFHQSGYERINEDLFGFINIGYKGHAGQIFSNLIRVELLIFIQFRLHFR